MKNIESQQLAPQIGEVVLYNPDDTIRLEVRMNDEYGCLKPRWQSCFKQHLKILRCFYY